MVSCDRFVAISGESNLNRLDKNQAKSLPIKLKNKRFLLPATIYLTLCMCFHTGQNICNKNLLFGIVLNNVQIKC